MINKCPLHMRQKEIQTLFHEPLIKGPRLGVERSSLEGQKRRKEGRERIREDEKEGEVLVSKSDCHLGERGHVSRRI